MSNCCHVPHSYSKSRMSSLSFSIVIVSWYVHASRSTVTLIDLPINGIFIQHVIPVQCVGMIHVIISGVFKSISNASHSEKIWYHLTVYISSLNDTYPCANWFYSLSIQVYFFILFNKSLMKLFRSFMNSFTKDFNPRISNITQICKIRMHLLLDIPFIIYCSLLTVCSHCLSRIYIETPSVSSSLSATMSVKVFSKSPSCTPRLSRYWSNLKSERKKISLVRI
jgi:hypothetical protein